METEGAGEAKGERVATARREKVEGERETLVVGPVAMAGGSAVDVEVEGVEAQWAVASSDPEVAART